MDEDKQLIRNLKREDELKNIEARRITEFIRPEILAFAEAMENTMREHDGNKGDSWKTCDIFFLVEKLAEEYTEADTAFDNFVHHDFQSGDLHFQTELVDLANVSAMLWNREVKE